LWLAACGVLLAAVLLPGCALKREYVRRGELLDSLAVRVHRLEAGQEAVRDDLSELRAEVLTQLEQQLDRLDQLDARFDETGDRLERIGLKLGMGRGNLTPQPAPPDTARPASQPDTAAAVVVGDSGPDPKAMYDVAYYDFTRGKFEVAIDGFEDFLKRFPESDNADNARYWVGECYYSMGQLERAETEFGRVLSEYPDGNKVPSAAYKLGMVKLAAGRAEDARARFRQVVEKYPGTNEARLAADRLQSMED
jgi:tol-pal system protein YbgF